MLEPRVLAFLTDVCPVRPGDCLLVAVSGGPDSVALLHLLSRVRDNLGFKLEVAHLDHGLRGEAGEDDARFVSQLTAQLGLPLHRRRVDLPAKLAQSGGSVEAAAREERYAFLHEARAIAGAAWIATGHSADDQVETFLMNLVRGAGPRGLGGMLPVGPGPLCRPLLGTWREEILAFLKSEDLEYREDSTNADLSFTRNRVRARLVPLLTEEFGDGVLAILARDSRLMNDVDDFLSGEANRTLRDLAQEDNDGTPHIRLRIPELRRQHRAVQRSVIRAAVEDLTGGLQELTLGHIDTVLDLVHREEGSGQADLPRGLYARREYEVLELGAAENRPGAYQAPEASPPLALDRPGELRWGRTYLRWREASSEEQQTLPNRPQLSLFDRQALSQPVYLRAVRRGDRLDPLGMEGSQKLSDLLINRKVPRHMRTWVPVLCDNGGPEDGERILWVVGQRRARHAAVEPETSQVLVIEAETIV